MHVNIQSKSLTHPPSLVLSSAQEVVQVCLRIHKILFFGQVFLCGLETPVLKLQKSETGASEYVSVVEASSGASTPDSPPEQVSRCAHMFLPSRSRRYISNIYTQAKKLSRALNHPPLRAGR